MDLRKLTAELSVAGQITSGDIPALAAQGIRGIVCNRPDGEGGADQATFAAIEQAAAQHGITIVYQPVKPAGISDADAAAFGQIVSELPKPALAYCRSGTRCAILWGLSQTGNIPAAEIVQTAASAGYDLKPFLPRLGK
jgi:sulfide:quinone oxidoreductase